MQVEQAQPGAVSISISGYGHPIFLELDQKGEPVVYIFAEDASDDHTHKISLANAKEQPAPEQSPNPSPAADPTPPVPPV